MCLVFLLGSKSYLICSLLVQRYQILSHHTEHINYLAESESLIETMFLDHLFKSFELVVYLNFLNGKDLLFQLLRNWKVQIKPCYCEKTDFC